MPTMLRVISFDLDGTLVDDAFDQAVWFGEIPRRYAAKHELDFETAKSQVVAHYRALRGHPSWTDMGFWFQRFDIGDWRPAAEELAHLIRPYPDALPVLQALESRYRLIIVTQAEPKFYCLKLKVGGLGSYFEAIYSTPERFGKLVKDAEAYGAILSDLGISGGEMLHVGDDPLYDQQVPSEIGIRSLLLDRDKRDRGMPDTIHDLTEIFVYLGSRA